MSVAALSRLLEAVAKSIRHATAVSTILATELFQARLDEAIATSKLLLENSSNELRNAPVSAKSLFDNKIKEVAKANYEAQQQRFLASSSTNTNVLQQKSSYLASGAFKIPRQQNKSSRPKQSQPHRSKTQTQTFTAGTRKDISKRSSNTKQFPFSKHTASSTKVRKPTLSTAYLTTPRYSSGRKIGLLCGTMGRINTQQMGPLYCSRQFQDTIQVSYPSSISSDKSESVFLSVITRRDYGTSRNRQWKRYKIWELSVFIPGYILSRKRTESYIRY